MAACVQKPLTTLRLTLKKARTMPPRHMIAFPFFSLFPSLSLPSGSLSLSTSLSQHFLPGRIPIFVMPTQLPNIECVCIFTDKYQMPVFSIFSSFQFTIKSLKKIMFKTTVNILQRSPSLQLYSHTATIKNIDRSMSETLWKCHF